MPARPGNWPLLGHSSDPVAGDPDQLHDLVVYYAKIAKTISDEAAILQRIGSGDVTELKGKAADTIRSRSKDVAASLTQTSGRYDAVARALGAYRPALDQARTDSARALVDAESAEGASGSSAAMPDPSANRPADAPPLTDAENAQVHARTNAIADAAGAGSQAKSRMDAALAALNAAGKAASGVIRGAWNDGLVDTRAYKLREGFLKFLRILVKVLMWIGVALAVLAFFIPGLGAAALAGAIVAVASVLATTALAAMGEGSWLDVIIAVVGVVLIGVGVVVAKIVQTAHVAALAKGATAAKNGGPLISKGKLGDAVSDIRVKADADRLKVITDFKAKKIDGDDLLIKTNDIEVAKIADIGKTWSEGASGIITKAAIKPQWWNVATKASWVNDIKKVGEVGGKYRFDRLFSTDRVGDFKKLQGTLQTELGVVPKAVPPWYYANAGRVVGSFGISVMKWSTTPTGFGTDTSRAGTSPEYTAAKAALTTAKPA